VQLLAANIIINSHACGINGVIIVFLDSPGSTHTLPILGLVTPYIGVGMGLEIGANGPASAV
jgi:hypothetical protein